MGHRSEYKLKVIMDAKEFYEKGGYEHKLPYHDEGGQNGVDDDEVIKMLEDFAKQFNNNRSPEEETLRLGFRSSWAGHKAMYPFPLFLTFRSFERN